MADITSEDISRVCGRFRVLIIGRRNAGKTTILERMTGSEVGAKPQIRDKEGRLVDDPTLVKAGLERGMSMIDYEITYPSSPRFIFHDSRGIEAGAESDCPGIKAEEGHDSSKLRIEYIQKFINDRAQQKCLKDQLHAIWFCMPMDTPRVPSDEFELAFLEKVNHYVLVIAILTKYEALIDRVRAEYIGKQVAKRDILNYAKKNVFDPLKNVTHIPAAIVQTHHKGEGCELLTKKTFEAIKDETLATIFIMAQQNSIKLACQFIFKKNLTHFILLKLKMATKKNNTEDLYNLVDQGLKFLPFWNLIINLITTANDDIDDINDDIIIDDIYIINYADNYYYDYYSQCRYEIASTIENWLKPNSMDILMDNFYIKFIAFVCLIGCLSLQYSKVPWKYITKAIEKLNNEGIRSHFIKDLEALYQKHKTDSEEFCCKIVDLVLDTASMC